ncbi:MAG: hypothetical protein ACRCUH_15335 [Shewanella sp.]
MSNQKIKSAEVLRELRVYIARHFDGVQKDYANSIGVSSPYVSAVLKGRSLPSETMLKQIGFSKEVQILYSRISDDVPDSESTSKGA